MELDVSKSGPSSGVDRARRAGACRAARAMHAMRAGAAALALALGTHALAAGLGSNLVVNGNAETNTVVGWVSNGGEPVSTATPGSVGVPQGESIGSFSFQGGLGPTTQTMTQNVDLSPFAPQIDAGGIVAAFHVLVQSRTDGTTFDLITGSVLYKDGGGATLGSVGIADPVIMTNLPDWSAIDDERVLPAGARSAVISFTFTREAGLSTDAYFDNAELVLHAPCPSDLNGDGNTDGADLTILLGEWGGSDPLVDLNGSGTVEGGDLVIVLGEWGPCE